MVSAHSSCIPFHGPCLSPVQGVRGGTRASTPSGCMWGTRDKDRTSGRSLVSLEGQCSRLCTEYKDAFTAAVTLPHGGSQAPAPASQPHEAQGLHHSTGRGRTGVLVQDGAPSRGKRKSEPRRFRERPAPPSSQDDGQHGHGIPPERWPSLGSTGKDSSDKESGRGRWARAAHRRQGRSVLGSCRPRWQLTSVQTTMSWGPRPPLHPQRFLQTQGLQDNTRKSGTGAQRVQNNPGMHPSPEPGEANNQEQGLCGWVRDD